MKQTILITGASRGIGLALTKLFLNNNYKVIGTSREGAIENFSHSDLEVIKLDLSDYTSIESAAKHIGKIDMLINNAALGTDLDTALPEIKSFQQTIDVNVTGTVFFTELMVDKINKGGKIVNVSSIIGSIGLTRHTDSVAYRMSKAALNMYTKIITNRLAGNIKVTAIHPGWVRTTIAKSNITQGKLSPEESAAKIYPFVISNFEHGIYWDVVTQSELEW
jgi:NAD(P)-dependent dehydrogenase (short-subunit alcohol dehydrogenase family)